MHPQISFSVVVNTYNRAASLRNTLESFRWLKYHGDFEVIVVNGPSKDDTEKVLASWDGKIKIGKCPIANISVSRNVGICMSQGDVVAFIDDDGIPEPEWLEQLANAYEDPEVGGAGGFVFDHTGYGYQYRYCTTDRLGNARHDHDSPSPLFCFPGSFNYPHLLGVNSSFRRDALIEIGGFDEEYEYFLDETDVCMRIVDAGYKITQLSAAYVHHKFAPSHLRNEKRVVKNYYPSLKNKTYFMMKNAKDYFTEDEIIAERDRFIAMAVDGVNFCVKEGYYTEADLKKFKRDVSRAVEVGMTRGREGALNLITKEKINRHVSPFLKFPAFSINNTKAIVLVTMDYPPNHGGGIATFNRDLAMALAEHGHLVHVVCASPDVDRVDFEDGVWVHRITTKEQDKTTEASQLGIHGHLWNWSMSALHEVERIASHRTIDVIEAPIWDCQAAAFLIHGRWPVVVSLQTTFAIWLESHPEMTANASWMREYAMPIMDLERWILQKAHAIRSISRAIMLDIEAKYGFIFDKNKIVISPLGLWSSSAQSDADSCKNDGAAEILFVGRLEARKGIDVLLAAIPKVLEHHPNTRFRIVGDNSIPIPGEEKTYKEEFFTKYSDLVADGIVVFEGKISDEELLNAYHRCDVFVSPSRYESFGLIFLEAMRESKPVIGCSVGGMPEIIIHQETGFLVPPGDQFELATAISLLASNRNLCNEMGKKGLALFNRKFTAMQMAKGSMPIYEKASCFYSRL